MPTCPQVLSRRVRRSRSTLVALLAAITLAACSADDSSTGEEEAAGSSAEETVSEKQVTEEEPTQSPQPDPDAPEPAIFADSDDMAHTMCVLWTTALDDEGDLRDVADDVAWYGSQANNEFMQSPVSTSDWGADNAGHTTVLCQWNGYEMQDGSPADLLR